MRPSSQGTDDNDELWPPDNTQERSFWKEAASVLDDFDDGSAAEVVEDSKTTFTTAATEVSDSKLYTSRPVSRTDTIISHTSDPSAEEVYKKVLHTSSDEALWKGFPSDELGGDEEASDIEVVETMISDHEDADHDPTEDPENAHTQESFDFSVTHSRNTSMTSIASCSPGGTSNLRKRTFEDMDPSSVHSGPTSLSKLRRVGTSTRDLTHTRPISLNAGSSHLVPSPPSGSRLPAPPATKSAAEPPISCGWSKCSGDHTHGDAPQKAKTAGPSLPPASRKPGESSRARDKTATPKPSKPASAATRRARKPHAEHEAKNFYVISSDRRAQALMDQHNLAWGVQYEIARGVVSGHWKWEDITEESVSKLAGSNAEAASKVSYVLKGKRRDSQLSLWQELDREEAAILENKHRGLGLQGEWYEDGNWYGGKIQQIAHLVEPEKDGASPKVILDRMQMTRSHRFGRFVGSRRLLQLKLPKNAGPKYQEVLQSRFVLCGRVFVALPDKDGKSYLLEINEDYERSTRVAGDEHRMSLEDFVKWHNPMEFNGAQPVNKWAARFDLGLSTSIPALRFEPENIYFVDDINAEDSATTPTTEQIMTDGCGFINSAALKLISKNLGYTDRPTAVQGRICGSKGLWLLHPEPGSDEPKIWIRRSQQKVKFGDHAFPGLNLAHYIFDIVAPSSIKTPTRLSKHTIINLAHNGVPAFVFANLMRSGLESELAPLMQWDGPHANKLLWNAVDKVTKTMFGMMQESASGFQRALGLSTWRDFGNDTSDEAGYRDADKSPSSRYLPGGKPIMRGELCLKMLQAGFSPRTEMFLHDELRKIIRAKLDKDIKSYHIPIANSAEAFIAADPLGILKEGEIAFTSSQPLKDMDAEDRYVITGDVLLYRNPARLPSDIRKVKAVYHHDLRKFTDVILLPTKGLRSLASLLAGGDLDGDVAVCIYEPSLVQNFKNSRITTQTPDLMDNFEPKCNIEQVSKVKETLDRSTPSQARLKLQKCLLSGLADSKVGLYSRFHEIAMYKYGYDHPETIRIADIFNCLLDSRKTGNRLKKDIWEKDSRKYGGWDLPECLTEDEPSEFEPCNPIPRTTKNKFILDELLHSGKKLLDDLLSRYDTLEKPTENPDDCMVAPYTEMNRVGEVAPELRAVEKYVKSLHQRWRTMQEEIELRIKKAVDDKKKTKKGHKVESYKKSRIDLTRELAADFAKGPTEESTQLLRRVGKLDTVMASYAYTLRPIFAFNMAFTELCLIKAQPSPVVFSPDFAPWMSMPRSAVRILSQGSNSSGDGFDP